MAWQVDGRVIKRNVHADDGKVYRSSSVIGSMRLEAHEGHRVRVGEQPGDPWMLIVECLEPEEHVLDALTRL